MKKFMIFLLMAFLYIGTCQARSESSHPNDAQLKLLSWVSPTPSQSFMTRSVAPPYSPSDAGLELSIVGESSTITSVLPGESVRLKLCPNEAAWYYCKLVTASEAGAWDEIQANGLLQWTVNTNPSEQWNNVEISWPDSCVYVDFVRDEPGDYNITATVSVSFMFNGQLREYSFPSDPVTVTVLNPNPGDDNPPVSYYCGDFTAAVYEGTTPLTGTVTITADDVYGYSYSVYVEAGTTQTEGVQYMFADENQDPLFVVDNQTEVFLMDLLPSNPQPGTTYEILVFPYYDNNVCGDPVILSFEIAEGGDGPAATACGENLDVVFAKADGSIITIMEDGVYTTLPATPTVNANELAACFVAVGGDNGSFYGCYSDIEGEMIWGYDVPFVAPLSQLISAPTEAGQHTFFINFDAGSLDLNDDYMNECYVGGEFEVVVVVDNNEPGDMGEELCAQGEVWDENYTPVTEITRAANDESPIYLSLHEGNVWIQEIEWNASYPTEDIPTEDNGWTALVPMPENPQPGDQYEIAVSYDINAYYDPNTDEGGELDEPITCTKVVTLRIGEAEEPIDLCQTGNYASGWRWPGHFVHW